MKRLLPLLLLPLLGLAAASPASAQEARFDVQLFRPSGAPQDLVMVGQSRPLSHLSVSAGPYFSFSLDPLVLVPKGGDVKSISLVGNRLQVDAMATVGLFDWAELNVDMPLVLAQGGDNLEAIGTEGAVQGYVLGDLRLTAKVAVPGLRRSPEGKGFGAALTFGLNLPTGDMMAFASDGEVTWAPGVIVDYRFANGLLLAFNGGFWKRPDRVFSGVSVGDMAPFGLGTEVPILRGRGLMAIGMVSGAIGLDKKPESPRQIPAELLVGLRWYTSSGLTFTFAGGGGCGCSLASPKLSFFSSIIWVPAKTAEWDAIERFRQPPEPPPPPPPPPLDSDGDSVTDDRDVCPQEAGLVDRGGCPIRDKDGDGFEDAVDKCPEVAAGAGGKNGCPLARIQGNKILILEQVNFATDQDIILSESFPILEEVSAIMKASPDLQRVLVEGHTDSRSSDTYNVDLSRRRAASVMRFLVETGVPAERLCSLGFGRSKPLANNETEEGMALNRRVEFTILPPAEGGGRPQCPADPFGGQRRGPKAPKKAPPPAAQKAH
ncbi:outer membrane exchange protein TraB [Myxococcaceae bacterium GXIMD 01537]